ncbi:MAG: type II toxin-antitoxin system VapC family toxin [Longimicrobiales bacterium]
MNRLVVDASALVEYLLGTEASAAMAAFIARRGVDLHIPALCDIEVVSAFRRALIRGLLPEARAHEALQDFLALPLFRHGHQALLPRCLGLKHVLSAYDATYVTLAEHLEAPLLTGDLRLARAARGLGVPCLPE